MPLYIWAKRYLVPYNSLHMKIVSSSLQRAKIHYESSQERNMDLV